ncbi:MAG: hypothetical protein ACI9FB_000589 [Candidatus Azotimanducaceae bacterium]|jgi:hypothetical protein
MEAPFSLMSALDGVKDKSKPPIHLWNPDLVKDLDMVIKANGDWFYLGTPIKRQRLVHLFASVLRLEEDGEYYLVTPVEKCRIHVEEVPFIMVLMSAEGQGSGQILTLTSNMAEIVTVSKSNPIIFEFEKDSQTPSPQIQVRDGLMGKLNRNVYYQLANLMVQREVDGEDWMGVWSDGDFIPIQQIAK